MKSLLSKQIDPELDAANIQITDDLPEPSERDVPELNTALATALEERPELHIAQQDLLKQGIASRFTRNGLLPNVSVYSLLAGEGLAGDNLKLSSGTGQSLYQDFIVQYPEYASGVSMVIPIRNRASQADNVRTAVLVLNLALKKDCYDRFLIATDTPTGIGVMPEGMIKSIAEMASLTDCAPEKVIAAATGNAAKVFRLTCGLLHAGKDADVLLIDAPMGASKQTALDTIKNGDVTAAVACFTAGMPRYIGRSRCTPPPRRTPMIVRNELRREFPPPPLLM